MKSIRHLWAALTLLLLWLPPLKAVEVQSDAVRIGVLAKRGESTALGKWQATADYLTRRIDDRTFHIVPLTFEEIPPVVRGGLADVFHHCLLKVGDTVKDAAPQLLLGKISEK
ncbi:MAG: hypothetical protein AB2807_05610, partial [Candidatus Sedimenticola endophacoides]